MINQNKKTTDKNLKSSLRDDAELRLSTSPRKVEWLKDKPIDEIIHELEVHQIELEMQNNELKNTMAALEETKDRYMDLYDLAPVGYLTISSRGVITEANLTAAAMLGVERGRLLTHGFAHFISSKELAIWEHLLVDIFSNYETHYCEILLNKLDSSTFFALLISTRLESDKGVKLARIAISDITERKQEQNEIIFLSFHDHLTGLYNRRFFEEEIKRLNTKRQLPLSVIMGDLNGLKLINDTFGHNEGDKVIKETAKLLQIACRSDDILARWGGDEFVILLPKTSIAASEEIAKRIKDGCSKLIIQKIPISLAIGIVTKTEIEQDMHEVIKEAERNMYRNKLVEKISDASSIIFALEQALFEKSNETLEHTLRLKELAVRMGKSLKLHPDQLDALSLLASLHDIGKVGIPETILLKKGKLTENEWKIVKRHPEIGYNIASSSPQIVHIAKFILGCHENWDGSGYPQGLAEEAIPILSRILLIADAYDVMTSERIYKKTLSRDEAIIELKRCAGTQFDPMLVDRFIEMLSNKNKI